MRRTFDPYLDAIRPTEKSSKLTEYLYLKAFHLNLERASRLIEPSSQFEAAKRLVVDQAKVFLLNRKSDLNGEMERLAGAIEALRDVMHTCQPSAKARALELN